MFSSATTLPDGSGSIRWVDVPGEKDPIVYLHGLGCASWSSWSATIARSGRPGALLDLPGHGLSDRPESFSYSLPDQADAVAAAIRAMDVGAVDVVSHSLGGSIAVLLAERHPELLRTSLLVEPGIDRVSDGPFLMPPWDEREWLATGWRDQLSGEVPERLAEIRLTDPLAFLRSALAIQDAMGGTMDERLLGTSVPTLLLAGFRRYTNESRFPAAGIRFERIVDGGHFVMNQKPREFVDLMLSFHAEHGTEGIER